LRLTGDAGDAEERTQDVFVRLWDKLRSFRGESAFSSWLHRLAVNVVLNERRTTGRRERRVMSAEDPDTVVGAQHAAPLHGLSIDLERAIGELPDGAREVFVLFDIEGYGHADIARLVGIAEGRRRRSYFERAVCYGRSWSDERTRAARRRQPFAEEHRAATRLVAGHRGSAGRASAAAVVLDSARCRGGAGRCVAGQKPTRRVGCHRSLRTAARGTKPLVASGRLRVGDWVQTDDSSRALVAVGRIGQVEVQPDTRVQLVVARADEHRMALARGRIDAAVDAVPRLFFVETPVGTAIDLGCAYSLETDSLGYGRLHVTRVRSNSPPVCVRRACR